MSHLGCMEEQQTSRLRHWKLQGRDYIPAAVQIRRLPLQSTWKLCWPLRVSDNRFFELPASELRH